MYMFLFKFSVSYSLITRCNNNNMFEHPFMKRLRRHFHKIMLFHRDLGSDDGFRPVQCIHLPQLSTLDPPRFPFLPLASAGQYEHCTGQTGQTGQLGTGHSGQAPSQVTGALAPGDHSTETRLLNSPGIIYIVRDQIIVLFHK